MAFTSTIFCEWNLLIVPSAFLTSSCTDSLNPLQSLSLPGGLQAFVGSGDHEDPAWQILSLSLRSEDCHKWFVKERDQLVAQLIQDAVALPAQWDYKEGILGLGRAKVKSSSPSDQSPFGSWRCWRWLVKVRAELGDHNFAAEEPREGRRMGFGLVTLQQKSSMPACLGSSYAAGMALRRVLGRGQAAGPPHTKP